MIDEKNIGQFVAKKLNWDVHPSLLESGDPTYLLNGDYEGKEGISNSWFAQNQLGNELCYEFPEDYVLKGVIELNNSESVLFFKTGDSYEIGLLDTTDCEYSMAVSGDCLNFENMVRGVYKFNNAENDRRIYFIDGLNPNRFLDIDAALSGDYPKEFEGSRCESCSVTEGTDLDCDALGIIKVFTPPCVTVSQEGQGQLLSGVYQVGVAYGVDNLVLTDYYFSPVTKAFSESSNISLSVSIDCEDNSFQQVSVILVSNTRENSLVVYNLGFFDVSTRSLSITSTDNATILSTQQALQKRTVFDVSEHIVTNGEILMLGKHQALTPLNYQPLANEIEIEWLEIKVPKNKAHLYPSFLRDEVYPIGIEWIGKKGNSRSKNHIPGRTKSEDDETEYTKDDFATNDIYELSGCVGATFEKWQIENTAFITESNDYECGNCSGEVINKVGKMGYWESKDFKYPNDTDVWGDLSCQPIRHHRMPSHELTHIHDNFEESVSAAPDCYDVSVTDQDGNDIYTYEYCPSGNAEIAEGDCVNILTIRLKNIQHPQLPDLSPDPDISGFRVLVGDRKGNKSILHKGLLFNTWTDTSTEDTTIYYPNYPFNDLFPDPFLSTEEVPNNFNGTNPITDWKAPQSHQRQHFTYHSPDIHFREIKQEFGTEMKVYGESIGWIEGKFTNVYLHPQVRLGINGNQTEPYSYYATQLNSVAHYSKFVPWSTALFSRFEILSSQYLLPINQLLSNGKKFNNYLRETSYYLEIGRTLTDPTTRDTSRFLASEFASWNGEDALPSFNYFNEVWRTESGFIDLYNLQAVSYYVGVKVKQPNQYAGLEQIAYRPVTCVIPVNSTNSPYESEPIYGGDVYISKHTTLRKMPVFTEWLEDVSIETETNYREFRNLWYPRFWYDNLTEVNDQYNLDGFVDIDSNPGIIQARGRFYVFVSGVIDYWCESEFIGNYREQDFTPNGSFYPKIDYNEVARTDKIVLDNKYLYNLTLLNNEIERVYQNLRLTNSDADFIVSYSLKNDFQSQDDKWLQFLPLNYSVLPRIYGRFSGMHYTDDYSIMFLFENEILYSQLNYSLNTNEGSSILLTQGDIFTNRLRKLSNEKSGYTGCVDPMSFVNTRYGSFFVDRYRKRVLQWTGTLKDITGNMSSWLQHFLATTYPGYTDLGVISVFDNFTENVYFTGGPLREKWTLSYKPKIEGFVGFHSFTPNFYISDSNTYLTSDSTGIWKHNKEGLYQEYYGEQVPFEIGLIINNQYQNKELQSVELLAEFIKSTQYGSNIYKKDKFFDKAFVYNNNGSTGLMTVLLKDRNNPVPTQQFVQNKGINSPVIIEVTEIADSIYRFNKFEDFRTDHNNQPLLNLDVTGMYYTPVSLDNTKAPHLRSDIKGKWIKLHLRSDDNTDHKILVQLIIPNQHKVDI